MYPSETLEHTYQMNIMYFRVTYNFLSLTAHIIVCLIYFTLLQEKKQIRL